MFSCKLCSNSLTNSTSSIVLGCEDKEAVLKGSFLVMFFSDVYTKVLFSTCHEIHLYNYGMGVGHRMRLLEEVRAVLGPLPNFLVYVYPVLV